MKVLIADDDTTTRLVLDAVLRRLGYEVVQAASGTEAWDHLAGPDPARVAILDWIMPGMHGPDLCRKLKARASKQPPYIILLTSKNDRRDLVDGLDAGADDFMAKPCDHEELRARLAVGCRIVNLQREVCEANELLEQRVQERTHEVEQLLLRTEELVHRLSHDLKTPLTPLLSLLPILAEGESDPERREMLDLAHASARHVHLLSVRALELCRVRAAVPPCDFRGEELGYLVEAALNECRKTQLVEARALRNQVPPGCRVRAEAGQVRQVLVHLLDNAVKFTAANGVVTIYATPASDFVQVAVADNGSGMDQQQLAHLFELFFKGDPARHDRCAVGLSLPIAKAIVERQGGRMWAESPGPRQGATLWFTLPAVKAA